MAGSTFENQYWTRIKLEMKNRTSAAAQTVYFINQPLRGQWLENYFPILLDVSELGVTAGQYVPEALTGSFTIDDTIGSYGFERKFSDILQRYEAVDAKVTLSYAKSVISETTPSLSFNDEWIGYVESISGSISNESASLSFSVSPQPFADRIVTRQIDALTFPTAPDQSIGNAVPLSFGNQSEVVPIYVGEHHATDYHSFAYGTEMVSVWTYTALTTGGYTGTSASIYAADVEGEYVPIVAPASISAFSDYTAATTSQISAIANPELLQIVEPSGSFTKSTGYLCAGTEITFYANRSTSITSTMVLKVGLWEVTLDGSGNPATPQRELTSTEINMTDHDLQNNSGVGNTWSVNINFPEVQVLNYQKFTYALSFSATGHTSGDAGLARNNASTTYWVRDTGTANATGFTFKKATAANYNVNRKLFQPHIADTAGTTVTSSDSSGLRIRYFVVYLPDYGSAVAPDPSKLRLIVRPTRTTSVEQAQNLIAILFRTWDGDSWEDESKFNTSDYASATSALFSASGQYVRSIIGSTQGNTTLSQIMEDLARNSFSRIGLNNSGQYFLWPWGAAYDPIIKIPQEDISVLSINIGSIDTVINRAVVNYGYTYRSLRLDQAGGQNTFDNYLYSLDPSDSAFTTLVGNSQEVYGVREAAESTLPYIYDATSARAYIDFLIINGREPVITSEIVIPYDKYRALKMLDIIEVSHPAFPSYFGASPNHSPITFQGTGSGDTDEVTGGKKGFTYWRAQTYQSQIESRFIKSGFDAPPLIRLVLRFLVNPNDPT